MVDGQVAGGYERSVTVDLRSVETLETGRYVGPGVDDRGRVANVGLWVVVDVDLNVVVLFGVGFERVVVDGIKRGVVDGIYRVDVGKVGRDVGKVGRVVVRGVIDSSRFVIDGNGGALVDTGGK